MSSLQHERTVNAFKLAKKMNNVTFGIIVAGRIREEGQGVAEIYPNGPDLRIYSAFLSKKTICCSS